MQVKHLSISQEDNFQEVLNIPFPADIFMLFISPDFNQKEQFVYQLNKLYPDSTVIGCSTAGEISDVHVYDNTISLTAIQLQKSTFRKVSIEIDCMECSFNAGKHLANDLKNDELRHILVLSDGLNINGADLVAGMKSAIPDVTISGGLAGDAGKFEETFIVDEDKIGDKKIVAIGFYGNLKVACSSQGGWDSFGIERLVTKSTKNVLYELDGMPALKLYKSFLGKAAEKLPSSGLLFPLSMRNNETSEPLVRTILGVSENDQSLTFAGNIPEGSYVRLMKANIDRLIGGAEKSAQNAANETKEEAELAILISCVGRRFVLKQLVEEEVEAVRETLGSKPRLTGFYSYGEIAPSGKFSPCELHNQTMTITTLSE